MKKIKQILKKRPINSHVQVSVQPDEKQQENGIQIQESGETAITGQNIIRVDKENTLQTGLTTLRDEIIQTINTNNNITLASEEKINADIAFIQLLIASLKYAGERGANVVLDFEFTEECEVLLGHSGLLETIKT